MFMSGQHVFKMLLKRPVIATVLGNMFNKLCASTRFMHVQATDLRRRYSAASAS